MDAEDEKREAGSPRSGGFSFPVDGGSPFGMVRILSIPAKGMVWG